MSTSLTRQTVQVDGRTISYVRAGDPSNSTLLLLHGIGGNASQFVGQLAEFGGAWDVIAWDAPGYGDSDDPGDDWQMVEWSDALNGFVSALGLQQVVLLGQSWGGVLAQVSVARHPQWMRALVLSDASMGGGSQPVAEAEATLAERLRVLDEMTPSEMARTRTPAVLGPNPSPDVLAAVEQMMSEIRPVGYQRAAIALAAADTRPAHVHIAVPTLVICGVYDRIVPLSTAHALQAAIAGAQLVELPEAGHLGSQEDPQRYNAALRDFLSTVDAVADTA